MLNPWKLILLTWAFDTLWCFKRLAKKLMFERVFIPPMSNQQYRQMANYDIKNMQTAKRWSLWIQSGMGMSTTIHETMWFFNVLRAPSSLLVKKWGCTRFLAGFTSILIPGRVTKNLGFSVLGPSLIDLKKTSPKTRVTIPKVENLPSSDLKSQACAVLSWSTPKPASKNPQPFVEGYSEASTNRAPLWLAGKWWDSLWTSQGQQCQVVTAEIASKSISSCLGYCQCLGQDGNWAHG